MFSSLIETFAGGWGRAETLGLGVELLPLFIPLGIWAAIPALRRRGEALLHLFALFTLLHISYRAYCQVFKGSDLAASLAWPQSPFLMELGAFHAAVAAALGLSMALQRTEWVKGLLTALALYSALSAALHLLDAFGMGNLRLAHLGPGLWHDVLFVFIAPWVIHKAESRGRPIYYVPR